MSDFMDQAAAWATARVMTNDYIQVGASYIGDYVDKDTALRIISMAVDVVELGLDVELELDPAFGYDHTSPQALDAFEESVIEVADGMVAQEDLEPVEAPPRSESHEIGGPSVDAAAKEIRDAQDRHEQEVRDLETKHAAARAEQTARDDKMQQAYFASHPSQSADERARDETKFESAKSLNQQDLVAKQKLEVDAQLDRHATELSAIVNRPEPPPPPARSAPDLREL